MKRSLTSLSEGILLEILVRLPLKSLIRSKIVSKSWLSLITSNYFIHSYRNFNKNCREKLIYGYKQSQMDNKPIRAMQLSDIQGGTDQNLGAYFPEHQNNICHRYGISGPVNGMYCIYLKSINASSHTSIKDIALWNPLVGQFHNLPKVHTAEYLRFSICGLGFHSLVNDYKVVTITTDESTPLHSLSCLGIYSFTANMWKTLKVSANIPWINDIDFDDKLRHCTKSVIGAGGGGAFFFNQACNWYYSYKDKDNQDYNYHCIASFHIEDEVFRVYKVPEAIDHQRYKVHQLTSLDNSLALVCSARDSASIFDVWLMSEFGVETSWCKIHSIATQGNITHCLGVVDEEFIFQDEDNGEFVFYYLFSPNKGCSQYFSLPLFRQVLPYPTYVSCAKTRRI